MLTRIQARKLMAFTAGFPDPTKAVPYNQYNLNSRFPVMSWFVNPLRNLEIVIPKRHAGMP